MKKSLFFSLAAMLAASTALAQLPDGSICPDFTGTDLNGNVHNLYDYLDDGYTVIVDVSATWCAPCWSYHNQHHLANLFDQYGPGTAEDRVVVLYIEGDQATTVADLNGTGGNTQGNWVSGTPYPIINDHTIASLLEITYFPTVYRICPDRIVTEVGAATTTNLWAGVQNNCFVATHQSDPALLPAATGASACPGAQVPLTVRLQNLGLQPLTSATIEARKGATLLGTLNWTGNLATYAILEVTVGTFSPTSGPNAITYTVTTPDDQANNNSTTGIIVGGAEVASAVRLNVKTDSYGAELFWRLLDPNDIVVASGGNTLVGTTNIGNGGGNAPAHASAYGNNQDVNVDMWLHEVGCYTFEFYDYYGDGICCQYGTGHYKIIDLNTNAVLIQGGEFAASVTEHTFNLTVGIDELELGQDFNIYPNPTTGMVNVNLELQEASTVELVIMDLLGAVVENNTRKLGAGAQNVTMDLSHLANGSYMLNIRSNGMMTTRKLTINR